MFVPSRLIVAAAFSVLAWAGCRAAPEAGPIPRPEHPRPDFERAHWRNLNGEWEFRFDPLDEGLDRNWERPGASFDRRIVVPFAWESKLSGLAERSGQQIGWYRRKVEAPADWKGRRVWLRFEAVDWQARVWLDGEEIGRHDGGYTPFAFDVTDRLPPGASATLVVRAWDPTSRHLPTGKQVARWYTFVSGIWQTVWLEARPSVHVESMTLTPRRDGGAWALDAKLELAGPDGEAKVEIASSDSTVGRSEGSVALASGGATVNVRLPVAEPRLWTPETPNLYPLSVRVAGPDGVVDEVSTYFGLRTVERGRAAGADYESILLNGEPVYLRGALDQSYNPDGLYTAPTDEFLRRDLELAKQAGFNFLRIHVKSEEPRRLYWADRLGVLVMEDIPNCWEQSPECRAAWEPTMRDTIERDRNHPSIFSWVLFNETWGLGTGEDNYGQVYRDSPETQRWVLQKWREAKDLDPSRLVEDNSPNKYDHLKTDINSWHLYLEDYAEARDHVAEVVRETFPGSPFNFLRGYFQDSAPLLNSEYGAVPAAGGDRDVSWGFRMLTTLLRREPKIQGYVYTELSDIEFEHNGVYNYDRSAKEFGYDAFVEGMTVADLQGADFIGFEGPPLIEAKPGERVTITPFVSHFSDLEEAPVLETKLTGVNDLGGRIELQGATRPVRWERFGVVAQQPVVVTVPEIRDYAGAVTLELKTAEGKRLAANFVNIVVRGADGPPGVERVDPRRTALRVDPAYFAAIAWDGRGPYRREYRGRSKFFGTGAGRVEYRFDVPRAVVEAGIEKIELLAELATKAGEERLDWPWVTNPLDYPQTDGKKHAGAVRVRLGGADLGEVQLADDPADARGMLSHAQSFHHGSHGEMLKLELRPDAAFLARLARDPVLRLEFVVPAERPAGLSIHGARSGRYPFDLTLIVTTKDSPER